MRDLDADNLLLNLIPKSIKKDENIEASAKALQPQFSTLYSHLHDALLLYRIDQLSSEVLDHLAEQWAVSVWRDSWTLDLKRAALKASITEKRRMGTLSAVKGVLGPFTNAAYISEWFEDTPQGDPYTFRVVVDVSKVEGDADQETIEDVMRSIRAAKNVRSQFTMTLMRKTESSMTLQANLAPWQTARIGVADPKVEGQIEGPLVISTSMKPYQVNHLGAVNRKLESRGIARIYANHASALFTAARLKNTGRTIENLVAGTVTIQAALSSFVLKRIGAVTRERLIETEVPLKMAFGSFVLNRMRNYSHG